MIVIFVPVESPPSWTEPEFGVTERLAKNSKDTWFGSAFAREITLMKLPSSLESLWSISTEEWPLHVRGCC
jgi:hypothetical protein